MAIDASGMLMSSTGEPAGAVGDRFTVHMDRDSLRDFDLGEYDVHVIMTVFEPDREIAWTVDGTMQPPIGHVYGYRLEPIDGGTIVTSSYDWSNIHEQYEPLVDAIFPVVSEQNLRGDARHPRPTRRTRSAATRGCDELTGAAPQFWSHSSDQTPSSASWASAWASS